MEIPSQIISLTAAVRASGSCRHLRRRRRLHCQWRQATCSANPFPLGCAHSPPPPPADEGEQGGSDDLLPDNKRRKLKGGGPGSAGRGRRGAGRAGTGSPSQDPGVVQIDDSDDDSDKELLREAQRRTGRATAASGPSAPASAGRRQRGRGATAPPPAALDPRSTELLQRAQAIQQRMKAAQADDLADEDDSELAGGCGWADWVVGAGCLVPGAPAGSTSLAECNTGARVLMGRTHPCMSVPASPIMVHCPILYPLCLPASPHVLPVVVRGAAAAAAACGRQRQQQQQQGGREGVDLTRDASGGGSDNDGGSPASSDGLAAGRSGGSKRYGAAAAGTAAAAAAADDGSRIELKLRNARGEKVLRMKRGDPFSKLFAAYRCAGAAGLVPTVAAGPRFFCGCWPCFAAG
jgi:hypothetical protein